MDNNPANVWTFKLHSRIRYFLKAFLLLSGLAAAPNVSAKTFQDDCAGIEKWDFLDWRGDGKILPTTDFSCPPGYGPKVLHIEGGVVLGMVKNLKMSQGTIVALYKENEPRAFDADGIIMVKSEYGMDISQAHNVKAKMPHLWLEQDNDFGVQLRAYLGDDKEKNIAERSGFDLVTDSWNKTNWIWQKVNFDEKSVRAKTWPAHSPEPQEWAIEGTYSSSGERIGFRINSGDIHLAYFSADKNDIPITTPPAFLYAPLSRITQPHEIDFSLFTNQAAASEKQLIFEVFSGEKLLAKTDKDVTLPKDQGELNIHLTTNVDDSGDEISIALPSEPGEGMLTLRILEPNGNLLVERTVIILPVQQMKEQFAETEKQIKSLSSMLEKSVKKTAAYKNVCVIRDAAQAHLDHAVEQFENGDIDDANMSFRFVDEALGELNGYKRNYVNELAPKFKIDFAEWDGSDRLGYGAAKNGVLDAYSMEHLLSFSTPTVSAQSFVMGHAYNVEIPWSLTGGTPNKDYQFTVRLVSPLGNRVVAQSTQQPEIPTSTWHSGKTYMHHVTLEVSPEDPSKGAVPSAQPAVLDEYHYLLISVTDPESGGGLILGNEPGPQPERVGRSFCAGDYYVSSTPLEIVFFKPKDGTAGTRRIESFLIENVGTKCMDADALFSVSNERGDIIFQDVKKIDLQPGDATPVDFEWQTKWAGQLKLQLQLVKNSVTLTEAQKEITISLPNEEQIIVARENHVIKIDDDYFTPINVKCNGKKIRASIYAQDRLVGEATGSGKVTVNAEPWFGYFDVITQIDGFQFAKRIIATVVETEGMDLLVNGEPFLVKGVNVHGLDGGSPERSASMMRIMRELGFNSWRGDYPPLWQMELAYELNSFYTVLGPFSCTGTDEIFARQAGPPMATARELSRLLVQRYKNSAGVLLWNSCNEIGNENKDFLLTLYPVFKSCDPYKRPVHYANLFGQNLTEGQDVMGVNNYFGSGQTAEDCQPIIQQSIDIAGEKKMPIIFNEFNSYAGAIHSTGVDAMYNMYDWGLEQGMCGGFQYMKGNSTSHPGIFDNGYNTHKIYNEAIIDVLADAKVALLSPRIRNGKVQIEIKNKRRFTLRQITLTLSASSEDIPTIKLPDMLPQTTREIEITLPESADQKAVTLAGYIEFITHYGFKSKVPIFLIAAPK